MAHSWTSLRDRRDLAVPALIAAVGLLLALSVTTLVANIGDTPDRRQAAVAKPAQAGGLPGARATPSRPAPAADGRVGTSSPIGFDGLAGAVADATATPPAAADLVSDPLLPDVDAPEAPAPMLPALPGVADVPLPGVPTSVPGVCNMLGYPSSLTGVVLGLAGATSLEPVPSPALLTGMASDLCASLAANAP